MDDLSLIIPLLNEEECIGELIQRVRSYSLASHVIYCDGGSRDQTLLLIKKEGLLPNETLISSAAASPSVLKTALLAKEHIKTKYVLIHPADADISNALENLKDLLLKDPLYAFFYKKYEPGNPLLSIQNLILNKVRSGIFKQFVWTNCPLIRAEDFQNLAPFAHGFLEDVLISSHLKTLGAANIIKKEITVSARRYQKDGTAFRMVSNFLILILFRLKIKSIEDLKKMYYR